MAPVAPEIIPGRPPTKALTVAIQNAAYSPTLGSTPAIIENANASGIRASATTIPASTSPRTLNNQFFLTRDHITTSLEHARRNSRPGGHKPGRTRWRAEIYRGEMTGQEAVRVPSRK